VSGGTPGPIDYLKALTAKKPGLAGGASIPRLVTTLPPRVAPARRVRELRELVGEGDGSHLPLIWPHAVAFGAHLHNMVDRAFPLNPMGVVHVRNLIRQRRPLRADELLAYRCSVEGQRVVEKGHEFDLVAEVEDQTGTVVWSSVSTMLARGPKKRRSPAGKEATKDAGPALTGPGVSTETWDVEPATARRFGAVSGDFNPIHLWAWSARLFGFSAPLAHGMWTLGRIAARVAPAAAQKDPLELRCEFKLPILLPARIQARWWPEDSGLALRVADEAGDKPHLIGRLAPLTPQGD